MSVKADVVINIAQAYVGVVMGTPAHHKIVDDYNLVLPRPRGVKAWYTLDWCDLFLTHIFDKAGASDLVGREIGVQKHIDIMNAKGIWLGFVMTPKPGDVICWNYDASTPHGGGGHHIGIVEKVEGGRVYAIAGNHGSPKAVRRANYALSSWNILGYGRPRYGDQEAPDPDGPTFEQYHAFLLGDPSLGVDILHDRIAHEVLAGLWGNGIARKNNILDIQNKQVDLIEKVFNYNAIQSAVNRLLADDPKIKKGDRVKVKKGARTYNGGKLTTAKWLYDTVFDVLELVQDRAVIGLKGVVTAAINVTDLLKQ